MPDPPQTVPQKSWEWTSGTAEARMDSNKIQTVQYKKQHAHKSVFSCCDYFFPPLEIEFLIFCVIM